jgi:hypothetical protein
MLRSFLPARYSHAISSTAQRLFVFHCCGVLKAQVRRPEGAHYQLFSASSSLRLSTSNCCFQTSSHFCTRYCVALPKIPVPAYNATTRPVLPLLQSLHSRLAYLHSLPACRSRTISSANRWNAVSPNVWNVANSTQKRTSWLQ